MFLVNVANIFLVEKFSCPTNKNFFNVRRTLEAEIGRKFKKPPEDSFYISSKILKKSKREF